VVKAAHLRITFGVCVALLSFVALRNLDDTIMSLLATFTYRFDVQYAIRTSVIGFLPAFYGSFAARRNFVPWSVLLIVLYWTIFLIVPRIFSQFEHGTLLDWIAPGIVGFFASFILAPIGAIAGFRFSRTKPDKESSGQYRRKWIVLLCATALIFVALPYGYYSYLRDGAESLVRSAIDSLRVGVVPEYIASNDDYFSEYTEELVNILPALAPDSQVRAIDKYPSSFEDFEVELETEGGPRFTAHAHYFVGSWNLHCCWKSE
jgi:hypothetical protein